MARHPTITAVVALVLAGILATTAANAADTTARAGLAQADAAAQKWQKDAVLVNLSTLQANPDGKAAKWGYMYYSSKGNKGYTVDVKDGTVVEAQEVNPHIKDPVYKEFADSDKAMAEAKKNGLTLKGRAAMSLLVMGQATKNPCTCWSVVGGFEKGDVSVLLDGKTGTFWSKQAMP